MNLELLNKIKNDEVEETKVIGNHYSRTYGAASLEEDTDVTEDDLGRDDVEKFRIEDIEQRDVPFILNDPSMEKKKEEPKKKKSSITIHPKTKDLKKDNSVTIGDISIIFDASGTVTVENENAPYKVIRRRRSDNRPINFDIDEPSELAVIAKNLLEEEFFSKGITRSEVINLLDNRYREDMRTTISRLERKGQMSVQTIDRIARLVNMYVGVSVWSLDNPDKPLNRIEGEYEIKHVNSMTKSNQRIVLSDVKKSDIIGEKIVDLFNTVIFPSGLTRADVLQKIKEDMPDEDNIGNVFTTLTRKGIITYKSAAKILKPLGYGIELIFLDLDKK